MLAAHHGVDSQPAHHTGSCEHRVVNRIGPDVAAPAQKLHLDDDQVVDVLEIVPDGSLREARIATADHKVASGSNANLASDVTRQGELTIVPSDINLPVVSATKSPIDDGR